MTDATDMDMIDTTRTPSRWLPYAGAALALLLAVLALVAMTASRADATAPDADSADAGFARDMAVHHQQAVELSFIVRDRTDDEDVRRLAYDIINTQANQRGMLLGRLDAWGLPKTSQKSPMAWMHHDMDYKAHDGSLMPGMATNTEMDKLRTAEGKDAEVLYLQLLTAHHRGGIDMAQGAADLAEDPTVVRLAQGMVLGQQSEMKLMADMLADRQASARQ
ncbi:DUF305 domain-containing protein [Streptomyces sp. NPDC006385]|uniref:DUF305 domain-containing protein n=1 Tax=Streptomyces sp. NPDC006385 TaxID=3156761 RepID=UPI0033B8C43C